MDEGLAWLGVVLIALHEPAPWLSHEKWRVLRLQVEVEGRVDDGGHSGGGCGVSGPDLGDGGERAVAAWLFPAQVSLLAGCVLLGGIMARSGYGLGVPAEEQSTT